jgi:hypothetical protein
MGGVVMGTTQCNQIFKAIFSTGTHALDVMSVHCLQRQKTATHEAAPIAV